MKLFYYRKFSNFDTSLAKQNGMIGSSSPLYDSIMLDNNSYRYSLTFMILGYMLKENTNLYGHIDTELVLALKVRFSFTILCLANSFINFFPFFSINVAKFIKINKNKK